MPTDLNLAAIAADNARAAELGPGLAQAREWLEEYAVQLDRMGMRGDAKTVRLAKAVIFRREMSW